LALRAHIFLIEKSTIESDDVTLVKIVRSEFYCIFCYCKNIVPSIYEFIALSCKRIFFVFSRKWLDFYYFILWCQWWLLPRILVL